MSRSHASPSRSRRIVVLVPRLLLAAEIAAASVVLPEDDASPGPGLRVASTSGGLSPSNSREGAAILTARDTRPGDGASGTVTILNPDDAPAAATLSSSGLSDVPGPLGGSLSQRLVLTVEDITDPARPTRLFEGTHDAMPGIPLGTYPPGAGRSYRFTVRIPQGGAPPSASSGDNLYEGASMAVQYDWSMTTAPSPGPAPPPVAPPRYPPWWTKPPASPPPTAPSVIVEGTVPVAPDGGLRLRIDCPGPRACAGTVTLWSIPRTKRSTADVRVAKRGRKLGSRKVLARRRFRVRASRTASVPVRLNRRGRALLRRSGRLRVTAEVSSRDAAGRPTSASRTIKLTKPRGKRSRGRR